MAAARSFLRGRSGRRRWMDWYSVAFTVVLIGVLASDTLAKPFSRLSASPDISVPAQALAGAALVTGAAAGLVTLAQTLGPLALSPADASWLLLSPLNRRGVVRRPVATAAAVSALAGGALGVLALAMAGPYIPHAGHRLQSSWLALAAVSGAGFFVAAVLAAVLAQPWQRQRARLRAACAVIAAAVVLAAVAGERWHGISRAVTVWFADISIAAAEISAAVAVAAACILALLVWRRLPRFPAATLRSDSARAATTRTAAAFLNLPLLTWIAEDNHWRGRLLRSRPWPQLVISAQWPQLSPAFALAWADWRRLARRPMTLTVLAASALAPALAGAAFTGHTRGLAAAATLLAGAIAAGTQGTAAARRDTNDPTLRRLLGVDARMALAARAALPAVLSAAWLTIALGLLVLVGLLHGWLWLSLGLAAGPGVAAAALRIARTAPINPADQGPDTPMGSAPPWLITRAFSVVIGGVACYPVLRAVLAGHLHASTFTTQLIVSAGVLVGYLLMAASSGKAA